jgi:hypothetical protein
MSEAATRIMENLSDEQGGWLLASVKRQVAVEKMSKESMASILNCRRKLILHFVVSSCY